MSSMEEYVKEYVREYKNMLGICSNMNIFIIITRLKCVLYLGTQEYARICAYIQQVGYVDCPEAYIFAKNIFTHISQHSSYSTYPRFRQPQSLNMSASPTYSCIFHLFNLLNIYPTSLARPSIEYVEICVNMISI